MKRLSLFITESLKNKGLYRQVTAALICAEFNKMKGKYLPREVAEKIKAVYLKGRVLAIAVEHSLLAQEVRLKESEILEALRAKFGEQIEGFSFLSGGFGGGV